MSDKYQKIDITADLDNGTYSAAVDSGIIRFKNVPLSNSDTTADLARIKMLISDNYKCLGEQVEAIKTGLSGDGVYWIDDISAYSLHVSGNSRFICCKRRGRRWRVIRCLHIALTEI